MPGLPLDVLTPVFCSKTHQPQLNMVVAVNWTPGIARGGSTPCCWHESRTSGPERCCCRRLLATLTGWHPFCFPHERPVDCQYFRPVRHEKGLLQINDSKATRTGFDLPLNNGSLRASVCVVRCVNVLLMPLNNRSTPMRDLSWHSCTPKL
jgi:hypothetical protein